jgi:hypothetical protein
MFWVYIIAGEHDGMKLLAVSISCCFTELCRLSLCNVASHLHSSGHYMYHQVKHSEILHFAYMLFFCVLCGSQNEQLLFCHTTLFN